MEYLKNGLLIISLLGNVAAIVFIFILTQTAYLDIPLAAYSHQKNCVSDFNQVVKMGDKLPAESRDQAKQLYANLVCQKDFQTGRSLTDKDFTKMFEQFQGQAATATTTPSQ